MNDAQPAVDPQQNLTRPARKQVPGPVTHEHKGQAAGSVNIWSGRQLGPRGERGSRGERRGQTVSAYRCKPPVDTGKTKGSSGDVNTFCLFFAKGLCYQGADCPYLHRLPTAADNAAMARTTGMDIFGRDKLPDGLDNRKGAGSYDRDMTTLYVHYGGAGHYAVPQLRHLLLENFGEFGPVKGVHIVPAKTIAFVKYHWRVSAEFAREALDQQALTGSTLHEVLSVRWANEDPNPAAVIGRKRAALDAAEAAAMSAWEALPPEEKRARLALAQAARAQQVSAVASALPEPLLAASSTGGHLPDDSFDAWRGFESRQQHNQQHQGLESADSVAGAAAEAAHGQHPQQQHQQQDTGQWHGRQDGDWDAQAAAEWQAYYAVAPPDYQQHDQQGAAAGSTGPGAWYQGWQQRHKPDSGAGLPPDMQGATSTAAKGGSGDDGDDGAPAAGQGEQGGLGLLAGYGSDSDEE